MTYPGGAPGGYPGQGPQQPLQGSAYGRPPGSGTKLGLPQILTYGVAGLGVLNFFVGFANIGDSGAYSASFFETASLLPGMFLLGALFTLPAILPGGAKPGIAPAAFSVTAMLTILFLTFTGGDIGVGTILMLIFGIVQAAAAVVSYLFDAGIMKPPVPGQPQYGHQQPGMYPPSGQFPGGQQPGQYPPPGAPGQQTTFAPQQGQFGQPGQQPGTPPGGYPQQ